MHSNAKIPLDWRKFYVALSLVGVLICCPMAAADSTAVAAVRLFQEQIEPMLRRHCYECHSADADEIAAGLRLDDAEGLRRGGQSGPVIDRQDPPSSLLIKALRHEQGLEMPPDRDRLPAEFAAAVMQWIRMGARDPRTRPVGMSADSAQAAVIDHWAFRPVLSPDTVSAAHSDWGRSAIDALVLEQLEARHWRPAADAKLGVWIRRVAFDLTGLPPTPELLLEFQRDDWPDVRERLVDRLLASPRYGERWAQLWLDVVRYAETEGFEYDRLLPGAWRYRDYVINSWNADKSFSQFVAEQLAGDELDPTDRVLLTASIFHRLGPVRRNAGNPDIALSRNEVLTERTDIVGTALLGLTIGCARCHSHKREPISQSDYYRLQAYFAATQENDTLLVPPAEQDAYEQEVARLKAEIGRHRKRLPDASGEERAELKRAIADLQEQMPAPPPMIPGTANDFAHKTPIHVLRRGVWEHKGVAVGPSPPAVLVRGENSAPPTDLTHPRTSLAKWLTDDQHPLTSRVIVNRLWQYHFGQGIVRTANDFGTHGDRPSHEKLINWLAADLVSGKWRMKPLQRKMVLSRTFAQASRHSEAARYLAADPQNRLLWRFTRRRLAAEELRDAMLSVAGCLNHAVGGPSIVTPVDQELVRLLYKPDQWSVTLDPAEHDRRSIYLFAKRNLRLPFMETFDAPGLQTSCARRATSIHAPQALELLNGPLTNRLAKVFAARLQAELGPDLDAAQCVERAFMLACGRHPSRDERDIAIVFLQTEPLREFTLALFNLNAFAYVE